ncbi:MAG: 5-formyltetrahydrofolate cyclo-ligase [Acidaminococcaceae bacterium]
MINKPDLRKQLKSLRKQFNLLEITAWNQTLATQILESAAYHEASSLLGYLSFGQEASMDLVLQQALADGKIVCVPEILTETTIQAVQLSDLQAVTVGKYGIRTPLSSTRIVCASKLDLVLVPGLGFSKEGKRLGMGAGYYDRFLPQVPPAQIVGVCYQAQICDNIPVNENDVKMAYLVTEQGWIVCS